MNKLFIYLAFLLSLSFSSSIFGQVSVHSTGSAKISSRNDNLIYSKDFAIMFNVRPENKFKIGPKINVFLLTNDAQNRKIYNSNSEFETYTSIKNVELLKQNNLKDLYIQGNIGIDAHKSLSIRGYDNMISIGIEAGLGFYQSKKTSQKQLTTLIISYDQNTIASTTHSENSILVEHGHILYSAVMASLNLSEILNPNRDVHKSKTYLVTKFGIDRYSDKSLSLYGEIGVRSELNVKKKRRSIVYLE